VKSAAAAGAESADGATGREPPYAAVPALCLHFANTVEVHDGTSRHDDLASYAELIAWSRGAGTLGEDQAERLSEHAAQRPAEAAAVQRRAVELREAIYRIFSALARGSAVREADLQILNRTLAAAMARAALYQHGGSLVWGWPHDHDTLDAPLWPVARSAAELLTSHAQCSRVTECGGDRCAWLFLDTTKNRSRRYCSTAGCGNRTRVRRHYARKRSRR
jgi:predicted RNA-binding Zn ribbon-like protein